MIDIHSHILAGIDDGAEALEDGLAIVRELVSQGVTEIIATPHYIDETIYVSPKQKNQRLLTQLKKALKDEKIDVELYLGNEIYICNRIDNLVESGQIATMNGSEYILVEFPMSEKFPSYEDILHDLILKGYKVILAHPERYIITQDDFSILERLVEMGVLLQCNTGSFIRQYGKHAEKLAVKLAKKRMIFALGSDIHHTRKRNEIELAIKKLKKYYSEDDLEQILDKNPRKIINGRKHRRNTKKK
jgi:protein-tyrosine phosphatase